MDGHICRDIPDAACNHCGETMPGAHLICVFCHLDGIKPNHEDKDARNARIVEAMLWS
jgi:hypothetical protein